MKRRTVLRGCGVTIAAGTAGCGGNTADGDGDVENADGGGNGGTADGDGGTENADGDGDTENADDDDAGTKTTDEGRTATTADGGSGDATTTTQRSPSMDEARLTPGESDCLSGEAGATVEFEDAVNVEGTISAANPCYSPELDAVSYDAETDRLSITIAAVDNTEDGAMCTSCVGGLQYSVRVTFENALPGAVTVRHEGAESGVVAESTR